MNALALLTEAREAGVKVTVDGTRIVLEGDGLTNEMVASFKANKPEILRLLTSVPSGSQIGSGTGTAARPKNARNKRNSRAMSCAVGDNGVLGGRRSTNVSSPRVTRNTSLE